MRIINIRQFQRNFYNEVKDLPVAVTRNGEPFITIEQTIVKKIVPNVTTSNVTTLPVTTPKHVTTSPNVTTYHRCNYVLTFGGAKYPCSQEATQINGLCAEHSKETY